MLFFAAAPSEYRKCLVVLRSLRGRESLAETYVRYFGHLIPSGVELWECEPDRNDARLVFP